MSIFRRIEDTKVDAFAIHLDACAVLLALLREGVCVYAKKSAPAVNSRLFHVLLVLGICRLAQIVKTIVEWIAVYVVNLAFRPATMNVQPNKPMSVVGLVVDSEEIRTTFALCPLGREHVAGWARSDESLKLTSQWVVTHEIAKTIGVKILPSHFAVLSQSGKRLASVSRTVRASPFYALE